MNEATGAYDQHEWTVDTYGCALLQIQSMHLCCHHLTSAALEQGYL